MTARGRLVAVFSLCVVWAFSPVAARAQQLENREYQIKAGYFAYFGNLVKWPQAPFAGANNSFAIGVLGGNPFGAHLKASGGSVQIAAGQVKAKHIQRKKITLTHYKSVADFKKRFQPCHILFVCRSATAGVKNETLNDRVKAALEKTKGMPILLVSEAKTEQASKKLAQDGVMISYWSNTRANEVRMFIKRAAAERERLTISSRLLGLRLVTVL